MGILDDNDPRIVHRLILPDGQVFVDEHANPPKYEQPMPRDCLVTLADAKVSLDRNTARLKELVDAAPKAEYTDAKCNVDLAQPGADRTAVHVSNCGCPDCTRAERLQLTGLPEYHANPVRDRYLARERAKNRAYTALMDKVGAEPPHVQDDRDVAARRKSIANDYAKPWRADAQPGPGLGSAVVTIKQHPMPESSDEARRNRCTAFFPSWPNMDVPGEVLYQGHITSMCKALCALVGAFRLYDDSVNVMNDYPHLRVLHQRIVECLDELINQVNTGYRSMAVLAQCQSVAGLHYDRARDAWSHIACAGVHSENTSMMYAYACGRPSMVLERQDSAFHVCCADGSIAVLQSFEVARVAYLESVHNWLRQRIDSDPSQVPWRFPNTQPFGRNAR